MIQSLFFQYLDLTIAAGLIIGGLAIFMITRIGLLPKKTLPFVIAALAGAVGFGLASHWMRKKLLKEVDQWKKEADRQKELLAEQKDKLEKQKQALDKRLDELDAKDQRIAVLVSKRDALLQKYAQAEADLERAYRTSQAAVRNAAAEKQAKFEQIDKRASEMNDEELLQALLNQALN